MTSVAVARPAEPASGCPSVPGGRPIAIHPVAGPPANRARNTLPGAEPRGETGGHRCDGVSAGVAHAGLRPPGTRK